MRYFVDYSLSNKVKLFYLSSVFTVVTMGIKSVKSDVFFYVIIHSDVWWPKHMREVKFRLALKSFFFNVKKNLVALLPPFIENAGGCKISDIKTSATYAFQATGYGGFSPCKTIRRINRISSTSITENCSNQNRPIPSQKKIKPCLCCTFPL